MTFLKTVLTSYNGMVELFKTTNHRNKGGEISYFQIHSNRRNCFLTLKTKLYFQQQLNKSMANKETLEQV